MMLIHLSLVNVYLTLLTRHFRDTEMNRNNAEILFYVRGIASCQLYKKEPPWEVELRKGAQSG